MNTQYETCDSCVPDDGWISPRMPIPNFSLFRASPQPRVEELSDDQDDVPQPHCQSFQSRISKDATTPKPHGGPARSWAGQLAGYSSHISPPPEYSSTPEHTPVPAFAERPVPMMLPARGAPAIPPGPPPPQFPAARPRTYQVPSGDEETSNASTGGSSSRTAHSALVAGNFGRVESTSSNHDGNSTVYPNDSASGPSRGTLRSPTDNGSFSSDAARHLDEGVVEVHDVCLAATQRHLEALRVNRELRHGRGVVVPLGGGPARRHRGHAGGRGSPYVRAGPSRRAASENDLENMRAPGLDGDDHDGGDEGRDSSRIPRPTDSLLRNTSYICDLVWRRALRDREDVLRAETGGSRAMVLLFECAETVVLYNSGEWEMDPERGFEMVCQAGRNLCRQLKDAGGVERVNDIESRRS